MADASDNLTPGGIMVLHGLCPSRVVWTRVPDSYLIPPQCEGKLPAVILSIVAVWQCWPSGGSQCFKPIYLAILRFLASLDTTLQSPFIDWGVWGVVSVVLPIHASLDTTSFLSFIPCLLYFGHSFGDPAYPGTTENCFPICLRYFEVHAYPCISRSMHVQVSLDTMPQAPFLTGLSTAVLNVRLNEVSCLVINCVYGFLLQGEKEIMQWKLEE